MDLASRLRRSSRQNAAPAAFADDAHDDRDVGLQDAIGNSGVARLAAAGAQAKLEVGGADDAHEQEADQIADEVLGGPVAQPARDISGGADGVQREGGGAAFTASADVGSRIEGATGGQTLPGDVQATMEAKTGASFEGVRVHDDAEAHATTAAVGAHAFTHGRDIHFAKGAYDPGSQAGKHLLAHELTHVVQQSGGQSPGVQRKAISAAPASVQRKGMLGGLLSNIFGGKKKKEEEVAPSIPDLGSLLQQPELREHWGEWNYKYRTENKADEGIAFSAWHGQFLDHVTELRTHARAAIDGADQSAGETDEQDDGLSVIATARKAGFRDKSGDEDAILTDTEQKARNKADENEADGQSRCPRDLLDPIVSMCAKSKKPNNTVLNHAEAYTQAWDHAWTIAEKFHAEVDNPEQVNLGPSEKQKFLTEYQKGIIHSNLLPTKMLNTEHWSHDQWKNVYKHYCADPEVQDFYRSRS